MIKINTIIFDLGGVLIDWNPRYVYKDIFKNDSKMEWFFDNICTNEWNLMQDKGYSMKKATEEKISEFPEFEKLIKMYYSRWEDMLKDEIGETVNILKKVVKSKKYKVLALTNWSHETFPIAIKKFDFLNLFEDIVVSGEIKMIKPDIEIYDYIIKKHSIIPEESVFIDDNSSNIIGAQKAKINGIHYKNSKQMVEELKKYAKGDKVAFIAGDTLTDQNTLSYYQNNLGLEFHEVNLVNTFEEWKKAYISFQEKVDVVLFLNNAGIKGWNDDEAHKLVRDITKIPSGTTDQSLHPFVLVSYAKDVHEYGEYASVTALKILNGTPISDIPITKNQRAKVSLNMTLAKKLNIIFPIKLIDMATLVK